MNHWVNDHLALLPSLVFVDLLSAEPTPAACWNNVSYQRRWAEAALHPVEGLFVNIRLTGDAADTDAAAACVTVPFENRGHWLPLREGKEMVRKYHKVWDMRTLDQP